MREITHHQIDGVLVQIVTPLRLREILDKDGDDYNRPADFGPKDEWNVDSAEQEVEDDAE